MSVDAFTRCGRRGNEPRRRRRYHRRETMLYLNLPLGVAHGWGICGRQVARHMGNRVPVRLLTQPFGADHVGNELEYRHLRSLLPPPAELAALDVTRPLPGPLLQPAD